MSYSTIRTARKQKRQRELRIVLVGRTGVGKSATGNTILWREEFIPKLSSSSVTLDCVKARGEVDGRQVAVVDTPGLSDTKNTEEQVIKNIAECACVPFFGPHVFLVVVELGKFTQKELDSLEIIQKTFGPEAAKYTMVLFTHGDQLKGTKIENFLSKNEKLTEFIKKCLGGYHVFNNNDVENRTQVTELLEKIEKMVAENGGGCYTTEMHKEPESAIKNTLKKLLERKVVEEAKEEPSEQCKREAREIARVERNAFLRNLVVGVLGGMATGFIVGRKVTGGKGGLIGSAVGAVLGGIVAALKH